MKRGGLCANGSALLSNVALSCIVGVEALHDLSGTAFIGSLKEHVNIHGELYGVTSWSRPEIVLTSLQA